MPLLTRRQEIASALRQRILSQLVLGVSHFGDKLPSVRALAAEYGVNTRVITAVCAELAHEGVVCCRDRSGIYIATPPENEPDWMAEFLAAGVCRGLPAPMTAKFLQRAFTERSLRALVVECNDDQIWSLSDELTRDYGLETEALDLDVLRCDPSYIPAARCDLIVTTSFHSDIVRPLARRLGVPMVGVTMCTGLFAEVARLLRDREVYFVVTDDRMERKLRRIMAVDDDSVRLHLHVAGRDDLQRIPDDSPVYVTRLTRARLPASSVPGHGIPEARVFSDSSVLELMKVTLRLALTSESVEPAAPVAPPAAPYDIGGIVRPRDVAQRA
ncbi:MAG: GntR family transcriptional regulator [Gemmatimonadaceae bacterium]|nr:GntR family transcriptional regulator [Gemmatimonadaceae bacterium]